MTCRLHLRFAEQESNSRSVPKLEASTYKLISNDWIQRCISFFLTTYLTLRQNLPRPEGFDAASAKSKLWKDFNMLSLNSKRIRL